MGKWPFLITAAALTALSACATTPQARIDRDPDRFAALPPEQQARIREGSVGVGFDETAVRLALGEPDRVIERESEDGLTTAWLYYAAVPGFYNGAYCAPGFPYYGYAYYCRPTPQTQYEERSRVIFKDGKVIAVERAH